MSNSRSITIKDSGKKPNDSPPLVRIKGSINDEKGGDSPGTRYRVLGSGPDLDLENPSEHDTKEEKKKEPVLPLYSFLDDTSGLGVRLNITNITKSFLDALTDGIPAVNNFIENSVPYGLTAAFHLGIPCIPFLPNIWRIFKNCRRGKEKTLEAQAGNQLDNQLNEFIEFVDNNETVRKVVIETGLETFLNAFYGKIKELSKVDKARVMAALMKFQHFDIYEKVNMVINLIFCLTSISQGILVIMKGMGEIAPDVEEQAKGWSDTFINLLYMSSFGVMQVIRQYATPKKQLKRDLDIRIRKSMKSGQMFFLPPDAMHSSQSDSHLPNLEEHANNSQLELPLLSDAERKAPRSR